MGGGRPGDPGVRARDPRRSDLGYRRRRAHAERRHRLAAQPIWAGDRQPRVAEVVTADGRVVHATRAPRTRICSGRSVAAAATSASSPIRVRAASGRTDGDVRGAGPADRGGLRPDPGVARLPGRQASPTLDRSSSSRRSRRRPTTRRPPGAGASYTIAALYAGDADEGEALLRPLLELGEPLVDFTGSSPTATSSSCSTPSSRSVSTAATGRAGTCAASTTRRST